MANVRVLHQIQVSPSLPSQPPQRLSFLDTIWLHTSHPVERLFFYDFPHPISHFLNHSLPILTKSLSLTLHHFYLLAGSIRPCPDPDDGFEIVYTAGDSVAISVAEFTGDDFHNISSHRPRKLENLRLLLPANSSSGGQAPPISIQITLFPNAGLCIAFVVNHAACDGSGSMQFIRSWAAACRSPEPALDHISPPVLDRSIIIDTCGIKQKIIEAVLRYKEASGEYSRKQDSYPVFDPSSVHATFTLGRERIARLKERVQAKATFHISAFVVTCGYVWRCLVKTRGCDGVNIERQYFGCAVDWRSRMRPPIPSNYFGNCLGCCMAELKVGDLVGENGIEVAAMKIGKDIHGLQGKDVGEVLLEVGKALESQMGIALSLSVAGSPRLKVYEADFGWGRPVKVDIISIYDSAAISLAESREEEGGLEIGVVLPAEEMNKFVKNFSGDLLDF